MIARTQASLRAPSAGALPGLALIAALLAAGCATTGRGLGSTLAVVVPEEGGTVGTVAVNPGPGETRLDTAYAAARADGAGVRTVPMSEEEVRRIFADALAARPDRPISYSLYFLEGRDEFTPDSRKVVDTIFAEVARRKSSEIVVIGHTDRVGSTEYNDTLSRQRAERVRAGLIQLGVPAERISAAGRGEREPLVPTDDEVREPRNRRVEILVR